MPPKLLDLIASGQLTTVDQIKGYMVALDTLTTLPIPVVTVPKPITFPVPATTVATRHHTRTHHYTRPEDDFMSLVTLLQKNYRIPEYDILRRLKRGKKFLTIMVQAAKAKNFNIEITKVPRSQGSVKHILYYSLKGPF